MASPRHYGDTTTTSQSDRESEVGQTPRFTGRNASTSLPNDLAFLTVRDLKIVFAAFQRTDEDIIELSQLADILELLGEPRPDPQVLATKVRELSDDPRVDGATLDFRHFLKFFANHVDGEKNVEVRTKEVFRALDVDDSDNISTKELQEALTKMGMNINAEGARAMALTADDTNDGQVNYREFRQICRNVNADGALQSRFTGISSPPDS